MHNSKLRRLVIKDMKGVNLVPLTVSMMNECQPHCSIDFDENDVAIKPNKFIASLERYTEVADSMVVEG